MDDNQIRGRGWTFVYGSLDLDGPLVGLQQRDRLLGAIADHCGGLIVSCYTVPSLDMGRFLAGVAIHPGPDGTVAFRENNWEFTKDQGAMGMGSMVAAEAGRCYLCYWEQGLGRVNDGTTLMDWFEQRGAVGLPIRPVAAAMRVLDYYGDGL